MATIKDIAIEAGVSQGTVSNVLNGKGNVSSDKILLVERAAAKLGYTLNQRAKALRKGASNLLAVLLPNIYDRCYVDFFLSFKHCAETHGYNVGLYLSNDIPQEEFTQLETIQAEMFAGLAVFSCQPCRQGNIYEELGIDKGNVIFVERRPFNGWNYIGFDYQAAGKSFAQRAKDGQHKNVCLVTDSLDFYDQNQLYEGFTEHFAGSRNCVTHHLQTDITHCYNHLLQFIGDAGTPDAFFISRNELAQRFSSILKSLWPDVKPRIYTLSSLFTMPEAGDGRYELNYRLMGNTAAEMLIKKNEFDQPITKILTNDGFNSWTKGLCLGPSRSLTVLTLDSPTAHIMADIARIYSKATGVEIKIAVSPYDGIYEILNEIKNLETYDVIRLDHTWLPGFAEKIFVPLEELSPSISDIYDTFIPGLLTNYGCIGDHVLALPETPSAQLLFFRKDLFESTIMQRLYKEQYGTNLTLPKDHKSFNQIAKFFTNQFNPHSPTAYGTILTLGNSGVAATEYLTRYFSHAHSLFDAEGNPLLNSGAALQAMKELVAVKSYCSSKYNNWWRDTAREFAQGNIAMMILFSNYASELLNSSSKIIGNIGYTYVPGKNPLIGGGCIGVSRYSRNKNDAIDFIKWYCSDKVSAAMSLLGSVSPCNKTYSNYEVIDTYPWLTLSRESILMSKTSRIPVGKDSSFDERKFLSILGVAVNNAYNLVMSESEALAFAYEMYQRSLN